MHWDKTLVSGNHVNNITFENKQLIIYIYIYSYIHRGYKRCYADMPSFLDIHTNPCAFIRYMPGYIYNPKDIHHLTY